MSYIFYDGDNVGDKFRAAYLENDSDRVVELSNTMFLIHAEIFRSLPSFAAEPIEAGGDEGLIECGPEPYDLIEKIRQTWTKHEMEVSIGFGSSIANAYKSCRAAKDMK